MRCSACGGANPDEARFCADCGVKIALPASCPGCGALVRPEDRFCNACGTRLAAAAVEPQPAAPRRADEAGARKVVSIVFADLTGSTALHERLDAESVRRFMDAYYQAMRGAVEGQGGTVTQLLGDGVKAVFGAPRVAEDDAIRAVRAAVAMQRAFAELLETQAGAIGRTGLRVAVNTGEVVASDTAEIIGDPVNVAARLQEQARDGDVVIGEATRRLVSELVTLAPLGVFALKGRSEAVAAYRVVSLDRPAGASATPFVGREAELRQILAVYQAVVGARRAHLAVVLGSPGLGKSRVLGEVARVCGSRRARALTPCARRWTLW
jgi:class 3 adenylate cyclase